MKTNLMIYKKNILIQQRKKGFTLVEVIVVLVILAILIAIAVPALTGYIDRASERKVMTECRQAVVAAQTIANEVYVTGRGKLDGTLDNAGILQDIITLSEIPPSGNIDRVVFSNGKLIELQYTNDGITVLYKDGKYTIINGDEASNIFTFKELTDEIKADPVKKQAAILANAKEVARAAEAAMKEALAEFEGGVYFTNGSGNSPNRSVNPNILTGANLIDVYDADGKMLFDSVQSNFDKIFVQKILANNSNIGYTSIAFTQTKVTIAGTTNKYVYAPTVTSITFKSTPMTGSQHDNDRWEYNVVTGVLTHKPPA